MNEQRILSEVQIEWFHRDGFLIVREMYSPQETRSIIEWTEEVASYPEVPGQAMMYFEESRHDGSRILCRVENFIPFHQGFSTLITARRMRLAVSELFGEPAVLFKDKINFKLPGGDGFKAHQDVQAGWDDYAGLHITAMIAIDATNRENGSLEVIAGMHKQGVLGSMWAPLTDDDIGDIAYVPVHCQPGDAVFFDSYTPHRSHPNHTSEARRVLYITYNKASDGDCREQYYADKRRNYPPDIEREPGKEYSFRV